MAALATTALMTPFAAGAVGANELPLWQTEIAKIPSTQYSRDALAYMTEGTEALRPWIDEEGLAASRLEPVLGDVASAYFDGARFTGRAQAEAAFGNLGHFEQYLKSRMTGASPPNGDAEAGHVTALVKSMTGIRLLADATVQDGHAVIDPFDSPHRPADLKLPAGLEAARAQLADSEANLAKTDEFFIKANIQPATINAQRAWSSGFAVLETFGIVYDGDHDGDGVIDVVELRMGSSPLLADSDFDGLTDEFEISELAGWTWPAKFDSDGDGADDGAEDVDGDGLSNLREQELGTSPTNPDTDGDGASDGAEVAQGTNPLVKDQPVVIVTPPAGSLPPIESTPTIVDSDGDGLEDYDETTEWLSDPANVDTDGDGLGDGDEIDMGIAPITTDTDGDGLGDAYEVLHEEDEGLDPRVFDERMSAWDYATDAAIGFVAGEFMPRDSIAWLAGNICSGALSFIPIYGWIAGAITDLRDTIGAAIHGDWVGAGLSIIGIIPYAGDAVSIPGKIVKWVLGFGTSSVQATAYNPRKLKQALRLFAKSDVFTVAQRATVIKAVIGTLGISVEALTKAGMTDEALVTLAKYATNDLEVLARAVDNTLHQVGATAPWIVKSTNPTVAAKTNAEKWVAQTVGPNAVHKGSPFKLDGQAERRPDVTETRADGSKVMHESKLGVITHPVYNNHALDECARDAALKAAGKLGDVVWHFVPTDSGKSLGAQQAIFDCLQNNGIKYTIHMPSMTTWP
ncbi:hypothetical protein [Antribacter gilvus]|uniref:hypothetical protein n=1 Tax=Antribacter gilvus TaxID=2304675 RepID=UPI000F782E94|nr:hypothetical protein [Antribacter gilvus]